MNAVITVIGKDSVGILSKVSNECAKHNVNITDVTQSVLSDMFCMIMIGNIDAINVGFSEFSDTVSEMGKQNGLIIHVMHEDIFNSMHKI